MRRPKRLGLSRKSFDKPQLLPRAISACFASVHLELQLSENDNENDECDRRINLYFKR